jgi:hypothetical protein
MRQFGFEPMGAVPTPTLVMSMSLWPSFRLSGIVCRPSSGVSNAVN